MHQLQRMDEKMARKENTVTLNYLYLLSALEYAF